MEQKIKKGDTVELIREDSYGAIHHPVGSKGVVKTICGGVLVVETSEGRETKWYEVRCKVINLNIIQKTMNAFKKAMLPTATKKFIEAGYIDEDTLNPTSEGMAALNFILWTDNEAKLLENAEAVIAERKEATK